jgi:GT2 family glycosyltransferase
MLPTFDLVVATVDRTKELDGLLDSLERQTYLDFRVIVVDQNPDDRLAAVTSSHSDLSVVRLRAERGLSRARNVALKQLTADVVAFPDDDCRYGADLLERVAHRAATQPWIDGITGRTEDGAGRSSPNWARAPGPVRPDNVWYRANSNAIFLRREVVEKVGPFDEELGLGSDKPWASGEETDYLVRALQAGARIHYDPDLVVMHPEKQVEAQRALRIRDGASVGYILGKHRYPLRETAWMLVRPTGGVIAALARRDVGTARLHAATLKGRTIGLRHGRTRACQPSQRRR